MSIFRRLAGETALYGLGTILPRVLNFLLVPLHTVDMFSRAEYGSVTKLLSIVAFVNVVYLFGMETAFFRFASDPNQNANRVFRLAQTVVLLISGSLSVLFIVLATPIATLLGIPEHPEFIVWLTLIMLTDAIVAIPFGRLRLEKKALLFASLKVINVGVVLLLNYYFLKIAYNPLVGVGYVYLAMMVANLIYIPAFFKTLVSWRPSWDTHLSPRMLVYGWPIMLTGLAGMTNEMFSRFTLEWWLPMNFYSTMPNEDAVGVFGACYKFAVFMNLGVQAFRYAAEPFFFSHAADKKSPEIFAKVNHYFTITGAFVLLAVSVNLDLLRYFIGKEFWDGLYIVPVLLLAYLFLGIYYNISIWFKVTDKTYYGTIITIGGAIVTIVGNYLLIPILGYFGSSIAALLCYGLMTAACYALGQKYHPVPYRILAGAAYIILALALIYIDQLIPAGAQVFETAKHTLILIAFLGVTWLVERNALTKKQ